MEARLHEADRSPDEASMQELEALWQRAKAHEKDVTEKSA
jgi:hypothetical protein